MRVLEGVSGLGLRKKKKEEKKSNLWGGKQAWRMIACDRDLGQQWGMQVQVKTMHFQYLCCEAFRRTLNGNSNGFY